MVDATQQIDGNFRTVTSHEAFLTSNTIVFTGATGLGAQGASSIFTVTGDVLCAVYGIVKDSLVSASGTISIGVTGNTATFMGVTTASGLDVNMGWHDTTPGLSESIAAGDTRLVGGGLDIIQTVATGDITGGSIAYYCFWRPLSNDGAIVAA